MLKAINKFFEIEFDENFYKNIFKVLKNFIRFDYGCISYDKPQYTFGKKNEQLIYEVLKVKNTEFGKIEISAEKFSKNDIETFKTCSVIIANIIKDYELSKIMKMQVKALQKGYLEVKEAEEIKTKFISHISHELRTPLNSIIGFSDMLGNEFVGKLNTKQKEYVNDIKVSGLNLLNMINEILDMSRIEGKSITINKQEFEIQTLINEVENIIKPLLCSRILEKKVDNFKINTDYQKLQQILLNLLSNAIKFTDENDGKITIWAKCENKKAVISIKDNGIGIAKENQSKIFEKFEQVNSNIPNSTGLGLSIVKELTKLLGGTVSLKSELDKGSEFKVTVPN